MNETEIHQTPGEVVARFRHRCGLTLHELGEKAGTPFTYVWSIEQGKRRPGPRVAERLSKALKMTSVERDTFLLLVAQHGKRQRTTQKAREIPQSLLLMIAELLTPHLKGKTVKSCCMDVNAPAKLGARRSVTDFVIEFTDGSRLFAETKFTHR